MVIVRVVDKGVVITSHAPNQIRIRLGPETSHPESRLNPVAFEDREDLSCVPPIGSGVEGQGEYFP